MTPRARQRFYGEVSIGGEKGSFILLDGKPVKTPAGRLLSLPSHALAQAVAEEWRSQGTEIRPETMFLTKLANTAIDRVAPDRNAVAEQVLAFGKSDLVCYRAEEPQELKTRQAQAWDPLLAWARDEYGIGFKAAMGIAFHAQPPAALAALEQVILNHDDFALTGLHAAAALTGSAIIALGIAAGRVDAETGFNLARLDEIYQSERWGQDEEAAAKARNEQAELTEISRFFLLLRE